MILFSSKVVDVSHYPQMHAIRSTLPAIEHSTNYIAVVEVCIFYVYYLVGAQHKMKITNKIDKNNKFLSLSFYFIATNEYNRGSRVVLLLQ